MSNNKVGKSYFVIFLGILLSVFVVYVCLNFNPKEKKIHNYYQVYLGGEKIGLIESDTKLHEKINSEQQEIKDKFDVENVYSPSSLEIQKVSTYKTNLKSIDEVYDDIKDLDPFTIEGYEVTINSDDNKKKKINILHKEDLDTAIKNTILAFVDEKAYENYLAGTQEEIVEEGVEITSIYLDNEITIKKAYISVEDDIITNASDLSQYFLFGSMDVHETYTVKSTDTLEKIAYNNKMGVSDLLVANPNLGGENALLAAGQQINVSHVAPLSDIVVESFDTEYQKIKYDTKVEFDKSIGGAEMYVKQQGVDGVSQVTFANKSMNGVILSSAQVSSTTLKEPIDRIVVYGSNRITYYGNTTYWAWPTVKPFRITSNFGYRIHPIRKTSHLHNGVDIAGVSKKSIFAIQKGTVISAASSGYNGGAGKNVKIDHGNGYVSWYMHLSKVGVKKGDKVEKGQVIGVMGRTGSATGIHLHITVYKEGKLINPLTLYK